MAALLFALTILTCVAPGLRLCTRAFPLKQVTVKVIGAGEEDGTEVWIAATPAFALSEVPTESGDGIRGMCEFRAAKQYGYSDDFLISYGDNIGTEFRINYTPLAGTVLQFYGTPSCGTVEVISEAGTQTLSLYRASPEMIKISIPVSTLLSTLLFSADVGILVISWLLLYFFFGRLHFEPVEDASGARDVSLDLIRTIAVFLVVSVHSFLASGYYERPLGLDLHSIGLTGIRWLCTCCNTLFLLLTGFLLGKRESEKKAIAALIPLVTTYFVITGIRIVVLDYLIWKRTLPVQDVVEYLFSIYFSWYLQMYIGIALITPFLNIAWKRLNLHGKQLVLVVLALLCCTSGVTKGILPSYWMILWPFLYYFCGAFIAEYRLPIKTRYLVVLLLGIIGLETVYTLTDTNGGVFSWTLFGGGGNGENQAFTLVLSSVLLFALLRRIKIRSPLLTGILKDISENAFCIYLFSVEITDNLVYSFLRNLGFQFGFLASQVLPVLCSFCFAWALSALLNIPLKRFAKWVKTRMNCRAEIPCQ